MSAPEDILAWRAVLTVQCAHKDGEVVIEAVRGLLDDAEDRGFSVEWTSLMEIGPEEMVLEDVQSVIDGDDSPMLDESDG